MASRPRVLDVHASPPGISRMLHEDGVRALMLSAAETCAARCNSLAHTASFTNAHYEAGTKDLRYLVAGVVKAPNRGHDGNDAALDNYHNNTLAKGCGI